MVSNNQQHCDPLAAYDYPLPRELVAQRPAPRRTQARLMVLERATGAIRHMKVAHLVRLLEPGDLVVLNDTRVVPARLRARKPTGGQVELLLLAPATPLGRDARGRWLLEALARRARRLKPGMELEVQGAGVEVEVVELKGRGKVVVASPLEGLALAERAGQLPLPPYIRRPAGPSAEDERRYQTTYAARAGAVAAPTAGLHLSRELIGALERRGVEFGRITLHVSYATFMEPEPEELAAGRLHPEWVEVGGRLVEAVERTRGRGGRVVAVGTTVVRALEWAAGAGQLEAREGWCELLITEGYKFRVVDALLTNFHLPRTTLLMLVAAFAGRQKVLDAYWEAVQRRYRFFSYGDAMFIC